MTISNALDFTASKNVLLSAINNIQSVVQNRNPLEILGNIHILASSNKVFVTATDMDILATDIIDADIAVEGALTINAVLFSNIIKKMPENEIVIRGDADSGKVQIKSGKSKFNLSCLSIEQFPIITHNSYDSTFSIAGKDFLRILNKSKFAMAKDEVKYSLNSINLKINDNKLIGTACDGTKLGRSTLPIEGIDKINMPSIILPAKLIHILSTILVDNENVKINISSEKISIFYKNLIIISKLIDATYPDVDRIIPDGQYPYLIINKESLIKTLTRVSLVCDNKTKHIKSIVSNNIFILNSFSVENGESIEENDIETNLPNDFKFNFNYVFLLEILNNISSNEVKIIFQDSMKCFVEDENEIYILMGIRA